MATLAGIAQYGYNAGWRGQDLVVAVAVALAESGGRETARGDVGLQDGTWGPSVGLWQIRSLNAEKGKGSLRDETANLDPQTNARNAYTIWKQSGWGPWTMHNNKAYLLFMPPATAAVTNFLATNPAAAAGTAVSAADSATGGGVTASLEIAKEPIRVLKWLTEPGTQIRLAKVVVGGALVIVAIQVVVSPVMTPVAKAAAKGAKLAAL